MMETVSRRLMMGAGVAVAATPLLAGAPALASQLVTVTYRDTSGADRAVATPATERSLSRAAARVADADADLTQIAQHARGAHGEVIDIAGTVTGPDGRTPVANATVEILQACALGDPSGLGAATGPADPNFQYYARLRTDRRGRFLFRTVRPGVIGARAPFVQLEISTGGRTLVTQMFFEGEARNASDPVLQAIADRRSRQRAVARAVSGIGPGEPAMFYHHIVLDTI